MSAAKKVATKSTKSRTRATPSGAKKPKASKSGGSRTSKRTLDGDAEDGAQRLRRAADAELGKNSREIASALAKRAMNGDLNAAKGMITLAEGKKPIMKKQTGPTLAEWIAAQPEWKEASLTGSETAPQTEEK